MLRCTRCGKPVMLLTEAQQALVTADPARYAYVCSEHDDA